MSPTSTSASQHHTIHRDPVLATPLNTGGAARVAGLLSSALSPLNLSSNNSSNASAASPHSHYVRDRRLMSDLSNYRRDLAVLETSGGGIGGGGSGNGTGGGSGEGAGSGGNGARGAIPSIQHNPPTAISIHQQVAPWMTSGPGGSGSNGGATTPATGSGAPGGLGGYYNDSTDNLSTASQLSPPFRPHGSIGGPSSAGRPLQTPGSNDSADMTYFGDERRPSIASVTTASSQGSRSSATRGGIRKLQGFFGEEFPGKEGAAAAPGSAGGPPGTAGAAEQAAIAGGQPPPVPGKEHRSHSYSHNRPHRDRNYSNATDNQRESSPSGSRPRTPVPSSDVVPFLYQEADVRAAPSMPTPLVRFVRFLPTAESVN